MSAEFQQRSQKAITQLAGKHYGNTAFENEKRSYPRAMIDCEQETYDSWEQFQQSIVNKSLLNLKQVNRGVVEYQGVFGKV